MAEGVGGQPSDATPCTLPSGRGVVTAVTGWAALGYRLIQPDCVSHSFRYYFVRYYYVHWKSAIIVAHYACTLRRGGGAQRTESRTGGSGVTHEQEAAARAPCSRVGLTYFTRKLHIKIFKPFIYENKLENNFCFVLFCGLGLMADATGNSHLSCVIRDERLAVKLHGF